MSGAARQIYQHDDNAAPDSEFAPGTLAHLAAGNAGRLLDPRRTPVTVTGLEESRGTFTLVVDAFEDAGASWELPLEDVARFQFDRDARRLPDAAVARLEQLIASFDGTTEIPATAEARAGTIRAVELERARLRSGLAASRHLHSVDIADCARQRRGSESAAAALRSLIEHAGLTSLEESFARTYASNPRSGEVVKGHAIVLAEMGFCAYAGPVVRDERLFDGDGSRERRRAHIVLRLAFLQELMALLATSAVELFRGVAIEGPLEPLRPASLIAATFSREVATAHFDSATRAGLLARQRVPVSRLLMTFIETQALNGVYREAEAVLIGEPGNPPSEQAKSHSSRARSSGGCGRSAGTPPSTAPPGGSSGAPAGAPRSSPTRNERSMTPGLDSQRMFATSGKARLAYDVTGEAGGADVLLIHAGVNDRRSWHHVVERLGPEHRCIAYDMRGFGDTTYESDDGWSAADDALAVLDAAGAEQAIVVACSMGGQAAIDLALGHPERVIALLLIGTAVRGAPYPELTEGPTAELNERMATADADGDIDELARLDAWMWLDGPGAEEGRVGGRARELFRDMNDRALRAEHPGQERDTPDAWNRLGGLTVPTLVLVGRLDAEEILAVDEQAAELIPDARLRWLDGVAHVPHLEGDRATLDEIAGFVAAHGD